MFYFPCSPVHKICLLFTELNNEDKHIFRDGELRKQSANSKQTQRKQIIYFHVNRYIIWICQRFVKQDKVLRFPFTWRRLINLQQNVMRLISTVVCQMSTLYCGGGSRNISCMPECRFNLLNVQLQKYMYYWSLEIFKSTFCSYLFFWFWDISPYW
jgi:hypothetical protein